MTTDEQLYTLTLTDDGIQAEPTDNEDRMTVFHSARAVQQEFDDAKLKRMGISISPIVDAGCLAELRQMHERG